MKNREKPSAVKPALGQLDLAGRLALRPSEAAVAIGVCARTLRGMTSKLPHLRVGGVLLFPVDGLRAWLSQESQRQRREVEGLADALVREIRERS